MTCRRRAVAEAVGTALLLATVVGSGVMAERLAGGNVALALLANALATGAGLVALILTFGPVSGAHFNPAVTLADAAQGGHTVERGAGLPRGASGRRVRWRCGGAWDVRTAAVCCFPPRSYGERAGLQRVRMHRSNFLGGDLGCTRRRTSAAPFAVAAYIVAAYWFTASTSFANPAVTLARAATDTFAGIRPADVPAFIGAQLAGAAAATALFRWLVPTRPDLADRVVDRPRDLEGE